MVMAIIMTMREMIAITIKTKIMTNSRTLIPIAPLNSAALECGANSHYEACADRCLDGCSSMDLAGTCGPCEERCVCDKGYKLSGGVCVLAENCGCWNDGRHYEVRADLR